MISAEIRPSATLTLSKVTGPVIWAEKLPWPWIVADANAAVASAKAQAELLGDFDPASPPVPYEEWNTIELADLRGRYKFVPGATPKRTFDVTMRIVVPRDEKGAKTFVQATVLDWLNKNADRKEAPYVILIPEKGIVPVFGSESGEPGSSSIFSRRWRM